MHAPRVSSASTPFPNCGVRPPTSRFPRFIEAAALLIKAAESTGTGSDISGLEAACDCLTAGLYHDEFQTDLFSSLKGAANGIPARIRTLACDLAPTVPAIHSNFERLMSEQPLHVFTVTGAVAVLMSEERLHSRLLWLQQAVAERLSTDMEEGVGVESAETALRSLDKQAKGLAALTAVLHRLPWPDADSSGKRIFGELRTTGLPLRYYVTAITAATPALRALTRMADSLAHSGAALVELCRYFQERAAGAEHSLQDNPVLSRLANVTGRTELCASGSESLLLEGARAGSVPLEPVLVQLVESLLTRFTGVEEAIDSVRLACCDGNAEDSLQLCDATASDRGAIEALAPKIGAERASLLAFRARSSGRSIAAQAVRDQIASAEQIESWLQGTLRLS